MILRVSLLAWLAKFFRKFFFLRSNLFWIVAPPSAFLWLAAKISQALRWSEISSFCLFIYSLIIIIIITIMRIIIMIYPAEDSSKGREMKPVQGMPYFYFNLFYLLCIVLSIYLYWGLRLKISLFISYLFFMLKKFELACGKVCHVLKPVSLLSDTSQSKMLFLQTFFQIHMHISLVLLAAVGSLARTLFVSWLAMLSFLFFLSPSFLLAFYILSVSCCILVIYLSSVLLYISYL